MLVLEPVELRQQVRAQLQAVVDAHEAAANDVDQQAVADRAVGR